jgi:tetratricopeptide (TPR) repeat protein
LVNDGKLEDAVAKYRRAIELDSESRLAYFNLGLSLKRLGKVAEAREAFVKVVELLSDSIARDTYAPRVIWFGKSLEELERWDEAIAAYRQAIKFRRQEKDTVLAYSGLASAFAKKGQLNESVACLQEALKHPSKYSERERASLQFVLGQYCLSLERHADAISSFKSGLAIFSNNADAHNSLAWCLATCPAEEMRDPATAIHHAQKAVELAKGNAGYWNTLGVAQYRAGEYASAITTLEKSLSLGQGKDLAWSELFLAMAQWHLDRRDEARKTYQRAIEWMDQHAADNAELLRFRQEAETLLGVGQ